MVKKQARCMVHSTAYRRMTKLAITHIVIGVLKWLNVLQNNKTGITGALSPNSIVEIRLLPA